MYSRYIGYAVSFYCMNHYVFLLCDVNVLVIVSEQKKSSSFAIDMNLPPFHCVTLIFLSLFPYICLYISLYDL